MDNEYQNSFPNGYAQGKKPHRFTFTYKDIALITGLSFNTIRLYASKRKFDPNSLLSVYEFIAKYKKNV